MTDPSFSVDLGGTGVTVHFSDQRGSDQRDDGLALSGSSQISTEMIDSLSAAVRQTLEGEGVVAGTVDVIVVDTQTITGLNIEHMGGPGPTDVLSFPLDDPSEGEGFGFTPQVGDIVLAWDIAVEQAPDHAGSVDAELHLLVIHSALHLLGHDHAEHAERLVMQSKERHYLSQFGFEHPGDQS